MKTYLQDGSSTARWILALGSVALVVGVVLVLALPAYRDFQVQSKVSEVFVSADACRAEVSRIVQTTSAPVLSTSLFACDGGVSAGVKISRYLKSIAVRATGSITVTLDYRSLPDLTQTTSTLTLVPLLDATTVLRTSDVRKTIFAWRCGRPDDGTTIPSKYLPSNCRG